MSCPFALLTHPAFDKTTVIGSVTIVSSSEKIFAFVELIIGDFLSSPNSSLISFNSFLINVLSLDFDFKIFSISSCSSTNSFLSFSILSCSNFANCLSLISKIAFAWISDNLNAFINSFFGSSEFLMIFITLSKSTKIVSSPSRICSLSFTWSRRCSSFRFTVSFLKMTHSLRRSTSEKTFGPPFNEIRFMLTL